MTFAVFVGLVLVGLVVMRFRFKRRRASTLAGLNVERPTFTVTPPVRSLIKFEEHRL